MHTESSVSALTTVTKHNLQKITTDTKKFDNCHVSFTKTFSFHHVSLNHHSSYCFFKLHKLDVQQILKEFARQTDL